MKLLEDITCPNCKKDFTKETDLDKMTKAEPIQTNNPTITGGTNQVLEQPKEVIKEVIKEVKVAPSDSPFYTCSDGNCEMDGLHKNKNYTKRT